MRTSLVDSGWSEVPVPGDEATEQLSQDDLRELVQAHTPERAEPRELPRYESSSDDAPESEQVHSDDATKRIAYAALLGGSQAGRGGPRQVPDRFYEQPTLVGHQPLSEEAARKLAGAEPESESESGPAPATPSGWTPEPIPAAEPPLPSFDEMAEPSVEDFERAAQRSDSSAPRAPESDPLPQLGFDDSDLTVRAEVKMPPEMFPGGSPPGSAAAPAPSIAGDWPAPSTPGAPPAPPAPPASVASAPPPAEPSDLSAEQKAAFAAATAPAPAPSSTAAELAREPAALKPRSIEQPLLAPEELEVPGVWQALAQRCRFLGMRLPLWLLWLVPCAVAGAAFLVVLGPGSGASASATSASAGQPSQVMPSAAPGAARATLQERAARGDQAALRQLAERPEGERSVDDAVAIAKGKGFQTIKGLEALAKQLSNDVSLLERTEIKERLFEYVQDRRTAPDALRLLTELPGPLGADLLYEIWTGTKKSNDITQLARELVYKPDVQARASEALKVALELRTEPPCQSIPAILPRAEQFGDWRSLHLLGKLLLPRGCGDDRRADCYPCLRNQELKTKINQAIKSVRSRPRPKQ